MRRKEDNSVLERLREMIKEKPSADFDDELFYTLSRCIWLGKEIFTEEKVTENYGKAYLSAHIASGKGKRVPLRDVILAFTDRYLGLDGLLLDDIIIEKGFIEEIISAVDDGMMTAVAEDISSYECEAAIVAEEMLQSFPSIQKWNADAVLTVPRVVKGDGKRAKERLAVAYRNVLSKAAAGGYHVLSVSPLSDYPVQEEAGIATSAVRIFASLNPDFPMSVTFVLPDRKSLDAFLSPPEHDYE